MLSTNHIQTIIELAWITLTSTSWRHYIFTCAGNLPVWVWGIFRMRVIKLYLYNRRGEKIFTFLFQQKKVISMPSSISSDGLVLLPKYRDMTTLLLKLRVDNGAISQEREGHFTYGYSNMIKFEQNPDYTARPHVVIWQLICIWGLKLAMQAVLEKMMWQPGSFEKKNRNNKQGFLFSVMLKPLHLVVLHPLKLSLN